MAIEQDWRDSGKHAVETQTTVRAEPIQAVSRLKRFETDHKVWRMKREAQGG